ncbi:MAG: efflux RND transporter periplasmic adaptor subunit [Acidobacteria bacterium]|jgi:RND family efflux transporter MFP subunit|nr:efflux RND transporter periplasmic adaptor subunit [Acidobacteriota bacterium]
MRIGMRSALAAGGAGRRGLAIVLAGFLAVMPPVPASASPVDAAAAESSLSDPFPSSLYVERDVKVAARRSGVIEKVLVDRGQSVRAGQALAMLETDLATHEVELAQEELRLAETELQRVAPLASSGIVSQQELQQKQIDRDLAKTRLAREKAMLDRCTVQAPFAGVVAERWAVLGERVQEDDNTPLFRVVASGPLRARVDLPEAMLARVAVGGRAAVTLDRDPGTVHSARVVFVSPSVDAASGTAPVIVELPAAGPALRPGSAVTVRLALGTGTAAGGRSGR